MVEIWDWLNKCSTNAMNLLIIRFFFYNFSGLELQQSIVSLLKLSDGGDEKLKMYLLFFILFYKQNNTKHIKRETKYFG
jgi:hypothetical protein